MTLFPLFVKAIPFSQKLFKALKKKKWYVIRQVAIKIQSTIKTRKQRETVPIHPSIIGFDIDGVIADTCEAFLRIAKQSYGISSFTQEDVTEFNVADCLPIQPAIVDSIFDLLMKDPVGADLKPIPHAVQVLTKMAKRGPVTLITARPLRGPIEAWLNHILPRSAFKQTRLIAMGDHDGKVFHIKDQGLQFFIDDRAETCLSIQREGITPFVFSQPWNRGKHDLQMVETWHCIEAKLDL